MKGGKDKNTSSDKVFTINDLSKRLKVSIKTLKKWEKDKRIPKAKRNVFGWRYYTEADLIKVVTIVQENGFFVSRAGKA